MSNQFDDQYEEGTTQQSVVDAEFADEGFSEDVAERTVSGEPIPSFSYYVAKPEGATVAYSFDDKTKPVLRHRFTIIDGPTGSIGQSFFAEQRMYVDREKWTAEKNAQGRNVTVPKSAEEFAEDLRKFQNGLNSVAQAFKLASRKPAAKTSQAIGLYGAQFEKAATVVLEVKKQTKNGFTKNIVWWNTVAALDAPALDAKLSAQGKTALDEAKLKIAEKNKALEAQIKRAGGTVPAPRTATSAAPVPAGSLD